MLDGVQKVESGYAGGNTENPTYKEVCTGLTNHAEVVKITYDPRKLSFDDILYAFWQSHDPTTLNRQGNDEGTQYRSVVFYSTEEEKQKTEAYIKKLNEEKAFDNPVVTQVAPLTKFYIAEDYHQNYYNNNKTQGYCMFVVGPKVEKFKKIFKDKLKH
jgi:peptide-methionine (S)-S-oxide reductase